VRRICIATERGPKACLVVVKDRRGSLSWTRWQSALPHTRVHD